MASNKVKQHRSDRKDRHSMSDDHTKADGVSSSKKAILASSSEQAAPATPPPSLKKKSSDTTPKSKADLILEKSPSLLKGMRDKARSKAGSPIVESKARATPLKHAKSPSSSKMDIREDSSEDDDEAFERLRAQAAVELETSKPGLQSSRRDDMDDPESDDDAPKAKSFKESKKVAIEQRHAEQQDTKTILATQKEKRRQRTQMQQEQSKQTLKKKEEAERRQKSSMEVDAADDTEDEDVLPVSVLKHAAMHSQTTLIQDEDEKQRSRRERKKRKLMEREMEMEAQIESKLVTVVPLTDSSGHLQLQSRKAANQTAENFLKEHFWGGRLERTPADFYMSERIRGPALQFIVPNGSTTGPSTSSRATRKSKR